MFSLRRKCQYDDGHHIDVQYTVNLIVLRFCTTYKLQDSIKLQLKNRKLHFSKLIFFPDNTEVLTDLQNQLYYKNEWTYLIYSFLIYSSIL